MMEIFVTSLSINSLSSYGKQIYDTCADVYDKTRDTCNRFASVAHRSLNQRVGEAFKSGKCWGAWIGYKIGSTRLTNTMLQSVIGFPIEKMHWSGLHLAVALGTVADVEAAIAKGNDVNAKDFGGNTPLHLSVGWASQTFPFLLTKIAEINVKNSMGWTPLHLASAKGNQEAVIALLQAGADMNANDDSYQISEITLSLARKLHKFFVWNE